MSALWLTFIPIFVAIDALGTLPLFLGLTRGATKPQRRRLILQAVLTAFVVAITIVAAGKEIFRFLGITVGDFKVAGGLILLIISVRDLTSPTDHATKTPADPDEIGMVPLGIPLILGPAVITTLLILVDSFGPLWTSFSLALNLLLVYVAFFFADRLEAFIGKNGAAAFGKVAALFLAAIGVMMIRRGLVESGLAGH